MLGLFVDAAIAVEIYVPFISIYHNPKLAGSLCL
jgi:hypothetical protein